MSKYNIIFIIFILIVNNLSFSQDTSSPEKIIESFIIETSKVNVDKMINCFALDEFIENYDFKSVYKVIGVISAVGDYFPNDYPEYQKINKYTRMMLIIAELRKYFNFLVFSNIGFTSKIIIKNDTQMDEFIKNIDPHFFSSIKLLYIRNPVSYLDKGAIDNLDSLFKEQANRIGATDYAERVALIKANNITLLVPFKLVKYNDKWFIDEMVSVVGNIRFPFPITKTDFLKLYQ